MLNLLVEAHDLAKTILRSDEAQEYLLLKEQMHKDPQALELLDQCVQARTELEEVERFKHFHPDYQTTWQKVRKLQKEIEACASIQAFLAAERKLDQLLYKVSSMLAQAVSDEIKVPSDVAPPQLKRACGCKTRAAAN